MKEKEKRKGKKMEEPRSSQQGMELGFWYGTMTFIMDSMRLCMTFHACMINSLSLNLGFC